MKKMEMEKVKAEHAYGFSELLLNISDKMDKSKPPRVTDQEWELFKKPGFYQDRKIEVVGSIPEKVGGETIYVVFHNGSYEIKSDRNFIHGPAIEASATGHSNLRYVSVKDESYEKSKVLDDLVRLNNGVL